MILVFGGARNRGFNMSNVLIGIIGVILFIGLALAGALFLGPRFQDSSTDSKAAAVTQQLKQVADAASLYTIQEGKLPPTESDGIPALVDMGYLKTTPSNPITGQRYVVSGSPSDGINRAKIIYTFIGEDDIARKVCLMIQKQSGGPTSEVENPEYPQFVTHRQRGCYANRTYSPGMIFRYMAYQTI